MFIFRKRYIEQIEQSFLKEKKITILLGSRRVGKTFLMKQLYNKLKSESVWVSFDEFVGKTFSSVEEFLNFLRLYGNKKDFKYIFLDEIQLVPGISWILKSIYDKGLDFHILCSGSGSFKIFSQIEDSLVGRANFILVYPLSFKEFFEFNTDISLVDLFNTPILWDKYFYLLDEFIRFGGYPEVVLADSYEKKIQILKQIYTSWIDKDIKFLLSGEDIINFSKFFRALAYKITSIYKINSLSVELGLKYNLISKYFNIAKYSYYLLSLPPLVEKHSYEIRTGEKIYFVDTGILNFIKGDFTVENRGELLENYVVSELLKIKLENYILFFWKKVNQSEIDIVIKDILNSKYYPIEVKISFYKNIPKIFKSFDKIYNVGKFFVFNKSYYNKRELNGKQVYFIPYMFVDILYDLI